MGREEGTIEVGNVWALTWIMGILPDFLHVIKNFLCDPSYILALPPMRLSDIIISLHGELEFESPKYIKILLGIGDQFLTT